jgi:hypothetical protein
MKIIKNMSEYKVLISKALSLTDRNIYSNTYGCVDRNYWHNKDGKGFYISSFQVICLGLSAHYYISKNLLFKNISKSIIEWFINNFFKRKCAEEYYSHQDSYCSLVYNLFAIVGSCALIKEKKFENPNFQYRYGTVPLPVRYSTAPGTVVYGPINYRTMKVH